MHSLGLRPPRLHAVAAGLGEFTGGALLALGLLVPLGAALITAVMFTAALTAHRGKGLWNQDGGGELPLVFATIAFALAAVGAGDASLDAALGLDVSGLGWALGALGVGVAGGLGAVVLGRHAPSGAHPEAA
jgi:putative oxidoreductase